MKVTAIIEKGENDFFSVFTKENIGNYAPGGYGESVAEAKRDFYDCLKEMKEIALEEGETWPEKIDVVFTYDLPSFFNFFDWINVSRFAKEAHINESKMRAYKNGIATASERTMRKISSTLQRLSAELQSATI